MAIIDPICVDTEVERSTRGSEFGPVARAYEGIPCPQATRACYPFVRR